MTKNSGSNMRKSWIVDLGFCDFERALTIQKKIHQMRVDSSIPDTLIFVEHLPVITLGKSGNPDNLLVPLDKLKSEGIRIYQTERGGDITYHGPGQLVGYPIFYIKDALAGIRDMIEKIESILILVLNDFEIKAMVKPKLTGVWVDAEKIASIGIAVKKWVTFHGFALNVTTDLSNFELIRPCGLSNVKMTSMEKVLGKKLDLTAVKERVKLNSEKVFGKKLETRDFLKEFPS
jgi:lipoate-protein ligase B